MPYSSMTVLQTTKCQSPIHAYLLSSTLQYKVTQKTGNDYNELLMCILISVHLFPINLNINCYYAMKFIEMIK
jgi:hypothetical protein